MLLYRCVGRGKCPRPEDTLLVIEVVATTGRVIDTIHRLAVYAEEPFPVRIAWDELAF